MWGVTTCGKRPIGEYENGEGIFCLKVCGGYKREWKIVGGNMWEKCGGIL